MEKVCLDPNEGLHVEDLNVFDKKYENEYVLLVIR